MNRVLRPIFAAFLICALLAPATASADPSSTSWSWPWSSKSQRHSKTILHPNPQPEIRRDHKQAEDQLRSDWLREKRRIQQRHRSALQEYVDTRIALAVERARTEKLRTEQSNRRMVASKEDPASIGGITDAAPGNKPQVLTAWWPASNTKQDGAPPTFVDKVRRASEEVPRRTREIMHGSDELVITNQAYGLPQGVAVFLALLMLHVPSLALASLVVGVVLVRGHRTHLGALFLSAAGILGILIFYVLPW